MSSHGVDNGGARVPCGHKQPKCRAEGPPQLCDGDLFSVLRCSCFACSDFLTFRLDDCERCVRSVRSDSGVGWVYSCVHVSDLSQIL